MPAMKHYIVTETREVRVTANNPTDAIRIASAGFDNGQNTGHGVKDGPEGVWGNTDTQIQITNMSVDEVR